MAGHSLAAAYLIAVVTTPAGISKTVLLLPFQVSVLDIPSPSVTPTNLLYNVIATPGALCRWRQGQTGGRLALLLIAGTLPGVVAGSVIRVKLIPRPARLQPGGRYRPDPAGGQTQRVRSSVTFRLCWLACGHSHAWGWRGGRVHSAGYPGAEPRQDLCTSVHVVGHVVSLMPSVRA
jgi:hypothetical protein